MSQPAFTSEACEQTVLAKRRGQQVTHCSCGTVHLTLRNVTLRLTPADLASLSDMLSEATAGLERTESCPVRSVH
jgi:hypothetical protein